SIPPELLSREQRSAIGLLALYRAGSDPAAPVEFAQVERYLQRDAHPPPLARPYVVDWVGTVDAPKSGTYRFKLDASGPASLWLASTDGEPRAVAVQTDNDVYLTNIGARQVQQVVGEGESITGLPTGLSVPSDVEVGPDGSVWVLDALRGEVVRLDRDGAVDR